MLFTDYSFFILVSLTFLLFYQLKQVAHQTLLLISASMCFYSWHAPLLLTLLVFSASINAITSYLLLKQQASDQQKWIAIFGVTINLLVLGSFKYAAMVGKVAFSESHSIGSFLVMIPLPVGISFFTFQGISLVIDSFKEEKLKRTPLKKHLAETGFYIMFFPQLVAGPIVKAHEFLPQIKLKRYADISWDKCFKALVMGYFLKMVVADNLKDQTYLLSYPSFLRNSSTGLCFQLFGYSMQIFADFAGYSLIAIGLAGLFGYTLKDNFNYPYIASSFSDFWRRWHISLSTFLKEYLYIPLGGNRKGATRTYFNLIITMTLGGLWHGAAISYAVWGLYHGIALAIERLVQHLWQVEGNRYTTFLYGCFVFLTVCIGWLLFKLPEFSHTLYFLVHLFRAPIMPRGDWTQIFFIFLFSIPVVIYHLIYAFRRFNWRPLEPLGYGLMLFLILTNGGSSSDFIYFQF